MLSQIAVRRLPYFIRQSARLFSTPVPTPKAAETTKPEVAESSSRLKSATHKVDNLERKMLVWTGKYKSADEVPTYVSQDVMEKTRNKTRIRIANIMMALTVVGCLIMVWSGKQAAGRGESVVKANLDWHKEYNEQSVAEAEAKTSQKK